MLTIIAETGAGTAPEAPGGNKMGAMGEAPVASDSGATKVGVEAGTSTLNPFAHRLFLRPPISSRQSFGSDALG